MTVMQRRVIASLLLLATLAASALTLQAHAGHVLPFDESLADLVQRTPGGRHYEPIADVLAWSLVEYALFGVAALVAWRAGDVPLAMSAILVNLARGSTFLLKEWIERDRPSELFVIVRDVRPDYGFPSGHALTATLVFGYVALAVALHLPARVSAPVCVAALACALLIGWERVWIGAHWPSDVAGGFAFGILLLFVSVAATRLAWRLMPRAA